MEDRIVENHNKDGIDRRGMLKCMAWVGTGVLWTLSGGTLTSRLLAEDAGDGPKTERGDFSFVQLSDSHVGFNKDPNKDVVGTLKLAIAKINAQATPPAFLLHTGDLTHLNKAEEFDSVAETLKTAKVGKSFYVPGEHDVFTDDAKLYMERYGKDAKGSGWHSFDYKGVHFCGLVNVMNLKAGGLGTIGAEQLDWLKKDLEGKSDSTPVVIFAHVPLWTVYEKWGWGTEDGGKALELVKRFGSVTVLNGHIHQVMKKVEGNVTFHTAQSTAFPQPEPGKAEGPGPIKNVAADKLRSMLGLASVSYVEKQGALATVDSSLEG
jgi:3',5'-cyclic AMP phosphodiesterase CpdA